MRQPPRTNLRTRTTLRKRLRRAFAVRFFVIALAGILSVASAALTWYGKVHPPNLRPISDLFTLDAQPPN
jgi:uncharacterized membrane protein